MSPSTAPTLQELGQATYRGIYEAPVTLTGGAYEGAPYIEGGASRPTVELVEGIYLSGDLAGDGRQEAAVFLAEQAAGSGTRLYLALNDRDASGVPRNLATTLLGDRVQIIAASMDEDGVAVRLVRAGPGDAACYPGEVAISRWTLAGGALQRVSDEIQGRLSTAELSGSRWRLESMDIDGASLQDTAVDLQFEPDRVSGRSGCNNYFGGIEDGDGPGEIRIGPLAGTRMACSPEIMKLEDTYLRALQAADHFSFLGGGLILTSVDEDGEISRLRFGRQAPPPSTR
ncbi:MAG: META domain-containing protein [Gammaproteobacteria bacterium]|jgi:heat shock protein HslJ